jgi:hypothetical protein
VVDILSLMAKVIEMKNGIWVVTYIPPKEEKHEKNKKLGTNKLLTVSDYN